MKKDIFTKDSRIKEMIEKLSGIPCAKSMLKDIPMDLLEMLSSLFSDLEISVKNDVVAEIRLKRNGEDDWNYYIAEPYPGMRILTGNLTGLLKLIGIGTGIETSEKIKTCVIHYCVKGRCEIQTKDGLYAFMKPGVLCVENRKHKEKNFDFYGEQYEGIEISFDLNSFDEEKTGYLKSLGVDIGAMLEDYDKDAEYYIGNVSPQLKNAESELDEIMRKDNPDRMELFLNILRINTMIRNGHVNIDVADFYLTKGQRKIVTEIHDYLKEHISESITVENMTEKYNVSHVSLNKWFGIMYGDTISKYLKNYRMRYASKLIAVGDKSISDVAAEVGYDNQGKFSAAFKRYFGVTPMEYRRNPI